MMQWRDLHSALESALAAPLEADCRALCVLMDEGLATLPDAQCLEVGGTAIALIAEVLFLKMQQYHAQPTLEPVQAEDCGVIFPVLDDEDDRWERQTMQLDLDSDEEDWGRSKKKPSRRAATDSVAAPVSPQRVLKMLQDLAGDEDPTRWSAAIAQWLNRQKIQEPIPIAQIHESIGTLTIVELWLGLLLGGFLIEENPATEEAFYHDISDGAMWLLQE